VGGPASKNYFFLVFPPFLFCLSLFSYSPPPPPPLALSCIGIIPHVHLQVLHRCMAFAELRFEYASSKSGNNYWHFSKTAVCYMARSTHRTNLISVPRIFHLLHKNPSRFPPHTSFTDTPVQRTRYHIEGFASPTVFPSQPSLY